jgi:outer membrane protein TolC
MWKMLTKEKQKASREQARAQLELERLDLIYNVLLAFPGALWTF